MVRVQRGFRLSESADGVWEIHLSNGGTEGDRTRQPRSYAWFKRD